MPETRPCACCGKLTVFERSRYKYCSPECKASARREAARMRSRKVWAERKAHRQKPQDFAQILDKANEMGLTYGQYVARYESVSFTSKM